MSVQNPFTSPQPNSTQQPNPAISSETSPATPGMPELPTTSNPGVPEGLNSQLLSIWKQDQLTGDWGGFRDQMLGDDSVAILLRRGSVKFSSIPRVGRNKA